MPRTERMMELQDMIERYVSAYNKRAALDVFSVEKPLLSAELKDLQKQLSIFVLELYGYHKKDGMYERYKPVQRIVENNDIVNYDYSEYEKIDFLPRCGDEYAGKIIDTVERFYPLSRDCPFKSPQYAVFRLTLDSPDSGDYRYVYFRRISRSEDEIKKDILARCGIYPLEMETDWEFITRYRDDILSVEGKDGYWYFVYIEDGSAIVVNEDSGEYLSMEEVFLYIAESIALRCDEEKREGRRKGKFKKATKIPREGELYGGRMIKELAKIPFDGKDCPFRPYQHLLFHITYEHEEGKNDTEFIYIPRIQHLDYRTMLLEKAGVTPYLQENKDFFLRRVLDHIRCVEGTDGYNYFLYFDYELNCAALHEWTGEFLTDEQIHKYLEKHLVMES